MAKTFDARLSAVLVVYIVAVLGFGWLKRPAADRVDADSPKLVSWGKAVYAGHCAACHGARLEGQPDWRRPGPDGRLPAPPHDDSGHTWHHSDRYLIRVVRSGLVAGEDRPPDYAGNMPVFGHVLTNAEIVAVLSFIKSAWSFDYRLWQERVTRTENH